MVSIRFECTTQLNDRIAANQFVTFQVLERVARSDLDIFLILIFSGTWIHCLFSPERVPLPLSGSPGHLRQRR